MGSLLRNSFFVVLMGCAFHACSVSTHRGQYSDGGYGGGGNRGTGGIGGSEDAGEFSTQAGAGGDLSEAGSTGAGGTAGAGAEAGSIVVTNPGSENSGGAAGGESGAAGSPSTSGGRVSAGGHTSTMGGTLAQGGVIGMGGQPPALKKDGETCATAAECVSKACTLFYSDSDGDTYGLKLAAKMLCGTVNLGYATREGDCCDTDPDAHPGVTKGLGVPTACGTYDYDCSKIVETSFTKIYSGCPSSCLGSSTGWKGSTPACGEFGAMCECSNCTEICTQTQQTCR